MQVLLDVAITTPSTYRMILRYTNPNPTPIKGEVTMEAPEGSGAEAVPATTVMLPPTGGQVKYVPSTLKSYLLFDMKSIKISLFIFKSHMYKQCIIYFAAGICYGVW